MDTTRKRDLKRHLRRNSLNFPIPNEASTMDTKGSFSFGFLLLLFIQLQPGRANPIYSLSPAKELASMEVRTLSFCKVKCSGCLAECEVVVLPIFCTIR